MDCEQFLSMLDRYVNNECDESEKALMQEHADACASCADELSFSLGIKAALSSMPKLDAPDSFISDLNKKIDAQIIPNKKRFDFSHIYKASSAAAACIVFAVILGTDVGELPQNTEPVISETVNVSDFTKKEIPEVTPPQVSSQFQQESSVPSSEAPNDYVIPPATSAPQRVYVPQSSTVSTKKNNTPSPAPVSTQSASKKVDIETIARVADNEPVSYTPEQTVNEAVIEQPVPTAVPDKVVVVNPTTPHSKVELPVYMDDKDSIIVAPSVKKNSEIKFEDFELYETEKLLEAFSLAELPSNKAIVATPTALSAVTGLGEVDERNITIVDNGAIGGSFFISSTDEEKVFDILNKYISVENDKYYLLTSKNYNAFIKELDEEGISYRDYMIPEKSSSVSFKIIVS